MGKTGRGRIVGHEDVAVEPGPTEMLDVARAMSMALRSSIQRHVTGLFVRSRKWTRPLSAASRSTYPQPSGYQKPGR